MRFKIILVLFHLVHSLDHSAWLHPDGSLGSATKVKSVKPMTLMPLLRSGLAMNSTQNCVMRPAMARVPIPLSPRILSRSRVRSAMCF